MLLNLLLQRGGPLKTSGFSLNLQVFKSFFAKFSRLKTLQGWKVCWMTCNLRQLKKKYVNIFLPPGVSIKKKSGIRKTHVEFRCGSRSNGCHTILQNFQGWKLVFSGISFGRIKWKIQTHFLWTFFGIAHFQKSCVDERKFERSI